MANERHKIKKLHCEIINGYSEFYCKFLNHNIFIRHLDNFLSAEIDYLQEEISQAAEKRGLLSLENKLKELEKNGTWTDKEEGSLLEQKRFLDRLKLTKSKMFLKAELDQIKYQISQTEKKVSEIEDKKKSLLGLTSEAYTSKKINDFFLLNSMYKDKELKELLFSRLIFDELENSELSELVFIFNAYSSNFNQLNLKKISLCPSYLNYFYLCNEDPFIFYGKPVCRLTFNQAETFANAKYFKYIISETKNSVPQDKMEDPDKLVEWFESMQNVQKTLQKYDDKDDLNVSLVGATSEDLENLGLRSSGRKINLAQEVQKKGGPLTMEDMLKLQGL